jgi:DNA-binding NarL/FixJ family response regulator
MRGISVVLVEDDARFRDAFVRAINAAPDLRLLGAAADAASGFRLMEAHSPDVLLIDLDLPDQPGIELIRHAATESPDCDIMVISVFGDERHVIESIEAGATGYLHKDSLPRDFVEQIRLLHAGASPISPVIARKILDRFQGSRAPVGRKDTRERPVLSAREQEVLTLVTKGFGFDEIARLLAVSPHTVMTYIKRIYRKLQVNSKTEAVYEARKLGLVRD